MEDDLNGRQPKWKTTSMRDDLSERQPQWEKTLRKPYRKITLAC